MLNTICGWWYNWRDAQEDNPTSFLTWLECMRLWWELRPRLVPCDFCNTPLYFCGRQNAPIFCDFYCANNYSIYGSIQNIEPDEIPF